MFSARTVQTTTTVTDDGSTTSTATDVTRSAADSRSYTYDDASTPDVTVAAAPPDGWSVATGPGTSLVSCVLRSPDGTTRSLTQKCVVGTVAPTLTVDGTWRLTVTGQDANGTQVSATADLAYTGAAPVVSVTRMSPARSTATSPVWDVAVSGATSARCVLTGPAGSPAVDVSCAAGPWSPPQPLTVAGAHPHGDRGRRPGRCCRSGHVDLRARRRPGRHDHRPDDRQRLDGHLGGDGHRWHRHHVQRRWCDGGLRAVRHGTAPVDGSVTLVVTATSPYGRTADASATYVRDSRPAAPTVTAPTAAPSGRATWTVTVDALTTTVACTVTRGTTTTPTPCALPTDGSRTFAVVTDLVLDGTYTLTVSAGNASSDPDSLGSATFAYDAPQPAGPLLSPGGSTAGRSAPQWTWASIAGHTTECRLTVDGVPGAWTTCTSGFAPTAPVNGTYVLAVRYVDALGQPGSSTSSTYRYDSAAPAAPQVVAGGGSPRQPGAVSFTITSVSDDVVDTECRLVAPGATAACWGACGGPWSLSTPGAWTFQVRQADGVGPGQPTSLVLDVDGTPPAAPSVSGPSGSTKLRDASWSVTRAATDGGVSTECRLVQTGVAPGGFTVCGPAVDVLDLADGTYRLEVRSVDAAGNRSASVLSDPLTVDNVAPAAPSVSGLGSTNLRDASWSVTRAATDGGVSTECRLVQTGVAPGGFTVCGPAVDVLDLADGTYRLEVRSVDAAGNRSASVLSDPLTVDNVAPAAPSVSGPSGSTKLRDASWSVTRAATDGGVSTECRLVQTGVAPGGFTTCGPTFDVLGLADGTYRLEVRSVDAAGNRSASVLSDPLTVDNVAPAAPSVSGPSGSTKMRDASWSVTRAATDGGVSTECRLVQTGVAPGGFTTCGPTVLQQGLADGTYRLEVRSVDAAATAARRCCPTR